jgi:hypothetical protein
MEKIFKLRNVNSRAQASLNFVTSMGTDIGTAEEMINHRRKNKLVFRPDGFKPLSSEVYFRTRFIAYMIPGLTYVAQKHQLPNTTIRERSIYKLIFRVLNTAANFVNCLFIIIWYQVLLNSVKTVSATEVGVVHGFLGSVIWATQCVRESGAVSKEALAVREMNSLAMSKLSCATIILESGESVSGVEVMLLHQTACAGGKSFEATASKIISRVTQSTPLAQHNKQHVVPKANLRRSSSVSDELAAKTLAASAMREVLRGNATVDSAVHSTYNIFSGGAHMIFPWAFSLATSFTLTVVRAIKGEPTLMDYDAGPAEVSTSIMMMVALLVATAFVTQVLLKDALSELMVINTWMDFMLGAVGGRSKLTNTKKNDELGFFVRLDNVDNVESYDLLCRSIGEVGLTVGEHHKKSFEVLSVICLVCVLVLFVGTVMDLEIAGWNVLIFIWSSLILVAMLRVFWLVVQIDSKMSKKVVKLLKHQMQLNKDFLFRDGSETETTMSEERRLELIKANGMLDLMCERIAINHVSLKILRVVQLREEVLVKFGAGIVAALFTTALRQTWND